MNQDTSSLNEPLRLVVINAGVSDPSSPRMLAERIAQKAIDKLGEADIPSTLGIIDLAPLAVDIARSIVAGFPSADVQVAIDLLAQADGVIAVTPVYKAGLSGLFKSFIDLLDNDLLIAKPVVLAATAGTSRHAMIVDEQMRPLFAYLRALPAPTSLFAGPEDWSASEFGNRINRAAGELTQLLRSGVGRAIANTGWHDDQHQFAGNATHARQRMSDGDFDSVLMRLATGCSLPPPLFEK
jgi:FMN reductase